MNKVQRAYKKQQELKWNHIKSLRNIVQDHPKYCDYSITVDALFDSSYYETGTIIAISPTREGFDDLHNQYNHLYRGGFEEIKVGDDYIIYGFEFD
jgi:hypothetical protein